MGYLPQVGDMLGRFRLVRQEGRGGMGVVFLATDTQLHIDVALKVLSLPDADQTVISRFKHEVLLARRVSHPGICRIFDLHHENGLFFITMEFCNGMLLERLLHQVGILSPWHTAQIISSVCKAMNAAHAQGVIHRDLKPGNIVVRPGFQISILDFGFSTGADITSVTKAGAAVGTVHYVAPEVLNHLKPTAAVDIYSVGVILYRCLTGYLPFGGDNIFAIMDAIRMGAVIPPRSVNPNLSKKMERVILKAMALNPNNRYHSFRELRKDLEDACGSAPKDLTNDPITLMLDEVAKDIETHGGQMVDMDSSSHFDLEPEPFVPPAPANKSTINSLGRSFFNRVPPNYLLVAIVIAIIMVVIGIVVAIALDQAQNPDIAQLAEQDENIVQVSAKDSGEPIPSAEPSLANIRRLMLAKGILEGDIQALDNMLQAIEKGESLQNGRSLTKEALSLVENVVIDESFVKNKLLNFKEYITALPLERRSTAWATWRQAEGLLKSGQYQKANAMLNTIVQ